MALNLESKKNVNCLFIFLCVFFYRSVGKWKIQSKVKFKSLSGRRESLLKQIWPTSAHFKGHANYESKAVKNKKINSTKQKIKQPKKRTKHRSLRTFIAFRGKFHMKIHWKQERKRVELFVCARVRGSI